jgi:NAD(P)-dependent dehydrogenase (short-subunit alcohol dehydrogenase family)
MRGLKGKRVVIAGGATGIGAATAERLAEEGASVVIGDINLEGAQATVGRIAEAGGSALAVAFDLSDEDSITNLVDAAVAHMGGIDALFNVGADLSPENIGRDRTVVETEADVWRRTLEVNLVGYALSCRAVIPHLLENGGGAIVNMSSGTVWMTEPERPAYMSSKAGIAALTQNIASSFGKQRIRCNAVAPGLVLSAAVQEGAPKELLDEVLAGTRSWRLGEPTDVAAGVAYLLSDDAEWVNGQIWSIDGGLALRY